jgi:membrane protein required for colicin V production
LNILTISPFDIAIAGIIIFGALTGLILGFVRGGLFVLSWAGAIAITVFAYTTVSGYSRQYIETIWLADLVGGLILFVVALTILILTSQLLSRWVRSGRLNTLDRSFGLITGIGVAIIIIAISYLFTNNIWQDDPPSWILESRTLPLVESSALLAAEILPKKIVGSASQHLEKIRGQAKSFNSVKEAKELLSQPPKLPSVKTTKGYNERQRREADNLFEKNK